MKKNFLISVYFILLSAFIFLPFELAAKEKSILYFADYVIGKDAMRQALKNAVNVDEEEVIIAKDLSQFEFFIASKRFDLVILMLHDQMHSTIDFPMFTSYVQNGGKVIFTDANRNNTFASLLNFSYSANSLNKQEVTIDNQYLKLELLEDQLLLTNPGYTTWSMGLETKAKVLGLFATDEASIIAPNPQTLVNGFLVDTLTNFEEGVKLFQNEITYLLSSHSVELPNSQSVNVSGKWSTNWNNFVLTQKESEVTGEYAAGSGSIIGTLKNDTLSGWWKERGHFTGCGPNNNWSGQVNFSFSEDAKSFTGHFYSCESIIFPISKSDWLGKQEYASLNYTQDMCDDMGHNWCDNRCQLNECEIELTEELCQQSSRNWCENSCEIQECENISALNNTMVKNALLAQRVYEISGVFGKYDFENTDDNYDWAFTTSENISYQLQGNSQIENDVFGWKEVSITVVKPSWYMVFLGRDVDKDQSLMFDWVLVHMNYSLVYKLKGVTSEGNFLYSEKIDIPYKISPDKQSIIFEE